MPDDLFDQAADIRRDDELMMIGAEATRGDSRVSQFIEAGFGKAYREGLHGPPHLSRHIRHHDARIDTPGKERAERDIALQSRPNGFGDQLAQPVDVILFAQASRASRGLWITVWAYLRVCP